MNNMPRQDQDSVVEFSATAGQNVYGRNLRSAALVFALNQADEELDLQLRRRNIAPTALDRRSVGLR